jgi:hypothetical protein
VKTTKRKTRKSQVVKVYNWLTSGKSINPVTAMKRFNIFRLAAVIYRLRHDYGLTIETNNKRGFATYKIVS